MLSEKQPDYYVADFEYYKDKHSFPHKIGGFKESIAKRAAKSSVSDMMKNR
jgi:hypothetical protein